MCSAKFAALRRHKCFLRNTVASSVAKLWLLTFAPLLLLLLLLQAAPQHLESQLAAAEVYGRKGRALLEAAAVKRARDIAGPEHPDVHRAIVRFAQRGEFAGAEERGLEFGFELGGSVRLGASCLGTTCCAQCWGSK